MLFKANSIYRILILITGIALFLLLDSGELIFISGAIILILYLLTDLKKFSSILQIDSIWIISFIMIISIEGIFDSNLIRASAGENYYILAAKYLNTINACFLIGFNLIPRLELNHNSIKYHKNVLIKRKKMLPLFILGVYLSYLLVAGQKALHVLLYGRFSFYQELSVRGAGDLLSQFVFNFGYFIPAIIAYHFFFVRRKSKLEALLLTILTLIPFFTVQIINGVRAPIIASIISIVAIYTSRYPISNFRALKFLILGLLAIPLTLAMKLLRGEGLNSETNLTQVIDNERSIFSERVVEFYARMIHYFEHAGYSNGTEHLAILLFWIPRAIWPEKPEQLEGWFLKVSGNTGFAEGHSITATFAATSLADFGIDGSIILWTITGIAAAFINRFCSYYLYLKAGMPQAVFAAIILGLTFFSTRQINLIIFLTISVYIIWFLYQRNFYIKKFTAD